MKALFVFIGLILIIIVKAQTPVISYQEINEVYGNFSGVLDDSDMFGVSVDSIGDINNDGITDIIVGASKDDDGGTDRGAVYIIALKTDGTVKAYQKISSTEGGFTGVLNDGDVFGSSVSSLGDLNGDGVVDVAVGAEYDGDGGIWHGAVWILFLDTNGTVQSHQKISDTQGGFTGILNDHVTFGSDIANLGDLNNDGNPDLAVGARRDDDGGSRRGAVWILFLNANGTVQSHQKISDTEGNFTAVLEFEDYFGGSVANIGDIDHDGVIDLAVGSYRDDDGGTNFGAIYILFLNTDGTVKGYQKISATQGGFTGTLNSECLFGVSLAPIGDLDWDNNMDIVVGSCGDDTGGNNRGAVFILHLDSNGTVKAHQKIATGLNGFTGTLYDGDYFGRAVSFIGHIGDQHTILVGASNDDDSGTDAGSAWLLKIKGEVNPMLEQNMSINNNINVYPNPTTGIITIDTDNIDYVEVLNLSGEIILKKHVSKKVDLSNEAKGIYILRATSRNGIHNYKIVLF